ncbi:MAG TPA: radical SAM family heme chaperone HemW, partial [Gammaproteobacteria bacterium]|nr:radical SAM family heme chaperone HemW [Gammaproteobacteria bacterium]
GGTPSLFPPAAIGRLLDGIRDRCRCAPALEITLEANPGTIERGRFADYAAAGVNRVSLGAQSFDAGALEGLGRIHGAADTDRAVAELESAGIANFNIDLMYGLPGQDVVAALADLEHALALAPTHLSHYQLTLEPGTVFYHRPPQLPDDDTVIEMQLECQERLADAGFDQYEVSAYARPDQCCRHNLNYWRYGDYLGIGAGAHGKWTEPAGGRILRSERRRQPREYLAAATADRRIERVAEIPATDRPFEFMLNVLRLLEAFDADAFESRTGLGIASIAGPLRRAVDLDLLAQPSAGRWQVTNLGQRFLNDLQALFLPDRE